MRPFSGVLVGLLLVGSPLLLPSRADGAGSRLGPSLTAIGTFTRGSAVAFDYKNNVYLVVSSMGPLNGRFVTADGQLVGSSHFVIHAEAHTHFPQVAFSPDSNGGAGGFLVSWHQSVGNGAIPRVRTVSYSSSGPLFGDIADLTTDGSWWEAGAQIAYSTVSKEFMVTWQAAGIRAHRVSTTGAKLGSMIYVTNTTDYFRDPSIAYSPSTDRYLISYGGSDSISAFGAAQLIAPGTGALVGGGITLQRTGALYITDAAYDSVNNRFLVAWWQPGGAFGRLLDANGTLATGVLTLSTRYSAYDALGIDFNPTTSTFMMLSHDQFGFQDGAVEISANGTPDGIGFEATAAASTKGNFYPQVAANRNNSQWLLSTATDFTSTTVQRLQSSGSGGATPPGAATLVSPSSQIGTSQPTFTWNASSGASHYLLWVTDAGGTRIQNWYEGSAIGCPAGAGTCSVNPGVAVSGTAHWWVQTWNAAGYGPWSAGMVFIVAATPGQAQLLSPDGQVSPNPGYFWRAVSGATHYYLWVADSTGVRIQQWYDAAAVGCPTGTGTCAVNPGIGLAMGSASWWIQTWNGAGYGAWSGAMAFTVTASPGQATLLSPYGYVSANPGYFWRAVSGATHYYLWVTDSAGVRVQQWYDAAAVGCPTGTGTCAVNPGIGLATGLAYWWIQTWNGAGYGSWSTPMTFTVSALGIPTNLSAVVIGKPTVRYQWTSTEGATHYNLWVNDSRGATWINQWFTATELSCSVGGSLCILDLAASGMADGQASFWLRGWSPATTFGPWSNAAVFTY